MRSRRILVVLGTRPEAIKLFPVIRALSTRPELNVRTCVTGQHRGLLDQVLAIAGLVPDIDLDLMTAGQSLDELTARMVIALGRVMDTERPDLVVVQGDTTTAFVGTLTAHYRCIPVGHVEAGLRSGNLLHPCPEEANRRMIGRIAQHHWAATDTAAAALIAEMIDPATVHITGNTVIDALHWMRDRIAATPSLAAGLDSVVDRMAGRRMVLVTTHRRENFGDGMVSIATAIRRIAERNDLVVLFPMHPNPQVTGPMDDLLGDAPNIITMAPLDYPHFVRALGMAHIVLTDSGGVQEEAPAFGKPVLVMRETTERPEGIAAGTARLVGTDADCIVATVTDLMTNDAAYARMARAHSPFGDGRAAARIADHVVATLSD